MKACLAVSRIIDRALAAAAAAGSWMIVALVLVVTYDVVSRYFGVPKWFGLTSTMLQESEYWLHSFAIVLVVGYAYIRQSHVRIDLLRDRFSLRTRYLIEAIGTAVLLIPYSALGTWLSLPYVVRSYTTGEVSKSQTGLGELWILKSGLVVLFVLLGLAGLSVFIKSVAGLRGQLPAQMQRETLGGDA